MEVSWTLKVSGSSPLARGLQLLLVGRPQVRGIIPARAGFTCRRATSGAWSMDHPRSRGVYGSWTRIPRTPSWIIPARAGFTTRTGWTTRQIGDHPRSRGVYPSTAAGIVATRGSSPLARGLPQVAFMSGLNGGIIPARAGFTKRGSSPAAAFRDHPRSRGVYGRIIWWVSNFAGSSPLARGLPRMESGWLLL